MEPGRAEVSDIRYWLCLSSDLMARRWFLFLVLTCLHLGMSLLTRNMGILTLPLGLIITQFFLFTLVTAAKASDNCVDLPIIKTINHFGQQMLPVLLIALIGSLVILAAFILGSFIVDRLPAPDYSDTGLFQVIAWLLPGTMRFFYLFSLITLSFGWFLFPLLAFHRLSVRESTLLSRLAFRKNENVILLVSYIPLLILVVLQLVTEMSLLIGAAFFPFYAVLLYVSYRQVFLQRKENNPAALLDNSPAKAH